MPKLIEGTISRLVLSGFLISALDQYTKYEVLRGIRHGDEFAIIPGFFNLVLTYNYGAAFGLFATFDQPIRGILLGLTTALALAVVSYFLIREYYADRIGQLALGMILGGAIGNIIDRLRLGKVVDFLDVYLGQHHWPAFNIADSAICIGVVLLLCRRGVLKE